MEKFNPVLNKYPQIYVTIAGKEDFPRLIEVWEAAVRETHLFLKESDIAIFKTMIREQFLYMVELASVRDSKKQVIGFAGVAQSKLEMLFVDPSMHRHGIGSYLLRHAIRTMGANLVDVNEQNKQAVEFYQHMGAKIIGRSDRDSMNRPFPLLHMRLPDIKK